MLRLLFALLPIGICGCADLPGAHPPATTSSSDIRLSDAQPMDDLEVEDVQVTLTNKLYPPDTTQPVYFGEADAFDPDADQNDGPIAAVPLIAIYPGSVWKAVSLDGPALANAGWKYVGAGPARNEVWGLLDTSAGDSQPDFAVAHTLDGGRTFSLKVFHKPCSPTSVYDFSMTRAGRGRITLSLDTNCRENKTGLYVYDTTDDGRTWSLTPRYEPDAMVRADSVSDEEQPQPPDKPALVVWRGRHVAAR